MRLLGRLRHAARVRWAAFIMDPWDRRSVASPFDFHWLAD
jgi:hypothetical protein